MTLLNYLRSIATCLSFISLILNTSGLQAQDNSEQSYAHFNLDACYANFNDNSNSDYSEFTAEISNGENCSRLEIQGEHLYREMTFFNTHSCTPGVDSSVAMCVSSDPDCDFNPGSDQSIKIDILVTPGSSGTGNLSSLEFYEQAPEEFTWINGNSGPNNYPTLFAVRVLKEGTEIYSSVDNSTLHEWNLRVFSFAANPEFTVDVPTVFQIELLAYCPIGNPSPVSAWDVDEIRIISNCCPELNGGELSGGPFEFCVGDGEPDMVSGIALTGNSGSNSQWVITDTAGMILSLPSMPGALDFDGAGPGICLIWHLSYEDGLSGLETGNNASDLAGCFSFSNSITVVRNQPEGGQLSGGPFEFCVGDNIPDMVTGIELTGNSGPNSQWIITDTAGTILNLPTTPDSVDFDGAGPGICLIWHLSYVDSLAGLEIGGNAADLSGCFSLSNSISVFRNQPEGGELTGGPFEFCVGDSIPDMVSGIDLTGNSGTNSQWVVTDTAGLILSLPSMPGAIDFDGAGGGVCLIWHLSYEDGLSGLEMGNNANGLVGCFSFSNPVTVVRNQPEGGELTGGPYEFCVGNDEPDHVSGIEVSGQIGPNTQWVITDTSGLIIGLPLMLESVDFDETGPGPCLIWNLSYFDGLTGLQVGNNATRDLEGCFSFSNAVEVFKTQPEGGVIEGGPFDFCVGDGQPDIASGIEIFINSGTNSQWIVTDLERNILFLPATPEGIDFDTTGPGVCLIWHLSYENGLSGLEPGGNINDLMGCYNLSNPITVVKNQPEGGELTGGPFEFCVGDGEPDMTSGIVLAGSSGANSQWVITDTAGVILSLPDMPEVVDFDNAEPGICLIWHLSYASGLMGLEEGNNASDLAGCFSLSNPLIVNKIDSVGCDTTGITADEPDFAAYPNPASSLLTLGISGPINGQCTAEVCDLQGRMVMTLSDIGMNSDVTLDVSGLAPGQYFIRITGENTYKTLSFMVLR